MPYNALDYLKGRGEDPQGRALRDLIAMSNEELARQNDYIRWVFPSAMYSLGAPYLSTDEAQSIHRDPEAMAALKSASDRLIRFYSETDYLRSEPERSHLDIARVIGSLALLVGMAETRRFYNAIADQVDKAGVPVDDDIQRYWNQAVEKWAAIGDMALAELQES